MTTTRRRLHEPYFIIWEIRAGSPGWTVQKVLETNSPFDDAYFAAGNYYADHAEASEVLRSRLAAERAERAERRRIQRATEERKAWRREYQRRYRAKKKMKMKKLREQASLSTQKGGDA